MKTRSGGASDGASAGRRIPSRGARWSASSATSATTASPKSPSPRSTFPTRSRRPRSSASPCAWREAGPLPAQAIQQAVWSFDKDQPVLAVMPLEQLAAESITLRRVSTLLLGFFAAVAVFLAALGLYGVMAHAVSRRTHEIGIRMAIGARSSDVLGMIVRPRRGPGRPRGGHRARGLAGPEPAAHEPPLRREPHRSRELRRRRRLPPGGGRRWPRTSRPAARHASIPPKRCATNEVPMRDESYERETGTGGTAVADEPGSAPALARARLRARAPPVRAAGLGRQPAPRRGDASASWPRPSTRS